jgi:hypothetical protein
MKWIWTLLFSITLSHFVVAQTSEDEFLYVTYGYKEQLLKGLDDKKGYSWKLLLEYKFVYDDKKMIGRNAYTSSFIFEGLYRAGETKPCAIVVIHKKDEKANKRDGLFICLPHPKSDSGILAKLNAYYDKNVDFNTTLFRHYSLALGKLSTTIAQF